MIANNQHATPEPLPKPLARARIRAAVRLELEGKDLDQAAREIGVDQRTLTNYRDSYPAAWEEEKTRAREDQAGAAPPPSAGPRPRCSKSLPANQVPAKAVADMLADVALMLHGGENLASAAQKLRINSKALAAYRERYAAYWEQLQRSTEKNFGSRMPLQPPKAAQKTIRKAVLMIHGGASTTEAAKGLGVPEKTLQRYRARYRDFWRAQQEEAFATFGPPKDPALTDAMRETIRQATALRTAGKSLKDAAAELATPYERLRDLKRRYPKVWDEETARAMEAAVVFVRKQAGTAQVLEDPESYLRAAMHCEQWARTQGKELFPVNSSPTLTSFYRDTYRPARLNDAKKTTLQSYETVMRFWALLTGDPPLKKITNETLILYRDAIQKMPGRARHGQPAIYRMSAASVIRHFTHIQAVLDLAGPAGPRIRDAVEILKKVPYLKRPKPVLKIPRIVTPEHLGQVYTAAVAMHVPRFSGVRAPAWWRALLVMAYNTQLRRRALFTLRMDEIDWAGACIVIPAERMKNGKPKIQPLNPTAIAHLQAIRTARELVFPWPMEGRSFDRYFHALQNAAGLPAKDHFGLHQLRATGGTVLWEHSPQAAQLALGHASISTTMNHYINGGNIVSQALNTMRQPAAFARAVSAVATAPPVADAFGCVTPAPPPEHAAPHMLPGRDRLAPALSSDRPGREHHTPPAPVLVTEDAAPEGPTWMI